MVGPICGGDDAVVAAEHGKLFPLIERLDVVESPSVLSSEICIRGPSAPKRFDVHAWPAELGEAFVL